MTQVVSLRIVSREHIGEKTFLYSVSLTIVDCLVGILIALPPCTKNLAEYIHAFVCYSCFSKNPEV